MESGNDSEVENEINHFMRRIKCTKNSMMQ